MRVHTLTRFDSSSNRDGTLGRFEEWATIEDDWKGNRLHVSAIPTGEYICRRAMYNKGGYETFEVTGVPNRSKILFHRANTEEDVEGCIGIASYFGVLKVLDEDTGIMRYKLAGLGSRDAFKAFMQFFEGVKTWKLIVKEYDD